MNTGTIQIWPILAGLGLFLFGMKMLEESLGKLAGRPFKQFLRRQTQSSLKAVFAGMVTTAFLQSSALVTLLVMSFTGAGIIGLKNGIGIILGANLGTTFTGWLVSLIGFKLNIEVLILPFLALGGLLTLFIRSDKVLTFSRFLMGFSFMFLGLSYMKNGFVVFATQVDLAFLQGKPLLLFLPVGFVLAASIQSSTASMMIFLSALATGILHLEQAVYLAIGADLGTTMTAIIGTINGNKIRKKTGWSQFIMNVISAILALILMPWFLYLIRQVFFVSDDLIALVFFHSLFNLTGIIVILPFLGIFTRLIDKYVATREDSRAKFITKVNPEETEFAITALANETQHFMQLAIEINKLMLNIGDTSKNTHLSYEDIKNYENEIAGLSLKVQANVLNEREAKLLNLLNHAIRHTALAVKEIKDVKHNIEELRNSGSDELFLYFEKIQSDQQIIYDEILKLIPQPDRISKQDLANYKSINKTVHTIEKDMLLEIVNRDTGFKEIGFSSLMNLTSEINNSNKNLYRSLEDLEEYYGEEG
jgi:phosphate:Na+ symporter